MLSVFLTILPVFLILGGGYLIGRFNILPMSVGDALNNYALKIGTPVLLGLAMYNLDFSKAFNFQMLLSFYVGAITCFILGIVLSRKFFHRRPGESISVGFACYFSNTILIGYPVSRLVFGEEILAPVFGIVAFHASLLYTIGMTTMEFSRQDGRSFSETMKTALKAIISNPLMIGILCGIFLNLTGIEIFSPILQALEMIKATAIPVSLIGIGMVLNSYSIQKELNESLMVSFVSLIVHPAIAFYLSYYVFGLDILLVQAAVVIASMPPGMNVYIFANMYQRAVGLSASVLVIANILAVFTITAWLTVLQAL